MKKKVVYYFFGLCDLITLCVYIIAQLNENRVPFYTDLSYIHNIAKQYGDLWVVYLLNLPILILYLSLFISVWCYFRLNTQTKWVNLVQIPLRLFTMISTLPFFVELLRALLFSNMTSVVVIFLIFGSLELAKTLYLFRIK